LSHVLPSAEWTQRPELAALVAALGAGNLRWVGGAVRDTLLGAAVQDIDAATPLHPQAVIERLAAAGVRTIPTGIDHGTVTAIVPGGNVEITTLRKDVSTDGRRATVAFAEDWREDAARRDFTINALYADPATLEIHDYFGGVEDLAAGRVRFIGDARARIREDYLRLLRYFRFQARFGKAPDAEAEEACAELAAGLKGLSRERVGWELLTLLRLPDPAPTVARMSELGVLQVVLPESEPGALPPLVAAERAAGLAPDALRRLAALLPSSPPVAEGVAARLRLSKSQRERLTCAAARDPADAENPRALAYRVGPACAADRLLLAGSDPAPVVGWEPPVLPLKGGEIVARGVTAGPAVARTLQAVERRWVAEGFPPRARVAAILDEELARKA
jgi:poly(A) polymerase